PVNIVDVGCLFAFPEGSLSMRRDLPRTQDIGGSAHAAIPVGDRRRFDLINNPSPAASVGLHIAIDVVWRLSAIGDSIKSATGLATVTFGIGRLKVLQAASGIR